MDGPGVPLEEVLQATLGPRVAEAEALLAQWCGRARTGRARGKEREKEREKRKEGKENSGGCFCLLSFSLFPLLSLFPLPLLSLLSLSPTCLVPPPWRLLATLLGA